MNQVIETIKRCVPNHRRERATLRHHTAGQPASRHRMVSDAPRTRIIKRLYPDWFALRLWEDDGGVTPVTRRPAS
jgi:hypothetical protein